VFILEVMGRHAGWIAAAGALAQEYPGDAPHIILLPEVPFSKARFLKRVKEVVRKNGYCVIVVSEGTQYKDGRFVADTGSKDAFGHAQLGGVAPTIARMIKDKHGFKYHWAVADYLQRSARHIASKTDVDQAYAVGKAAVEFALAGKDKVMPTIVRTSDSPYRWKIGEAPLSRVANVERKLPKSFIASDGFGITAKARRYLAPLIAGEDYPSYRDGLPQYVRLKNELVKKKLRPFRIK
jgi:6-phosphofructokinase 1